MALDWTKATKVSAWNGSKDPNEKRQGQYNQQFNPDGSVGDVVFLPYEELEKQEPGVWTQKYGQSAASPVDPPSTPPPTGTPTTPTTPAQPAQNIPTIGSANDVMVQSDPSQTVEGRMNSLLSKDSSWLSLNRANALKASNARGLSNSTMAVRAGEAAAIEGALPIAQQDAGSYQQNLNTAQQGVISSKLSGQDAAQELRRQAEQARHQADLYRVQGDVNMALQNDAQASDLEKQADWFDRSSEQSTQDFTEQQLLNKQTFAQQVKQSDIDFNHQSSLNQQGYTQETAMTESDQKWKTSERKATEEFNAGVNDLDRQKAFAAAISPLGQQYINDRSEILMNPDYDTPAEREAALNLLDAKYNPMIIMMGAIFGIPVDMSPEGNGAEEEETGTVGTEVPKPTTNMTDSEIIKTFGLTEASLYGLRAGWKSTGTDKTFAQYVWELFGGKTYS